MLLAFLGLVGLVPSTPASAAEAEAASARVAVHPLKSLGLDLETLGRLEEVLRGEMERVPGIELVEIPATRAAADEIGCDGKPACLGPFATKLGAAVAVYGVVAALGESYNITLKAVDGGGQDRGRVQKTIGGEETVLIDGIRGAAYQLLRPDLYVGKLELQVPVAGADVQIDGRSVGVTPLDGPIHGLSPGKHALKIVSKGFSDFDKFVEVRFQRTSVVSVDLEGSSVSGVIYREEPPPPLVAVTPTPETPPAAVTDPSAPPPPRSHVLRWAGVGVGGAGLLAAGGAVVFVARANKTSGEFTQRWEDEGRGPDATLDGADWQSYQSDRKTANALYLTAGIGLAAGAGLVVIDLLQGGPQPQAPAAEKKPEASARLLVGPSYLGLRVSF
ncbi:MAG: PEGA domain-containing protein [Deltaproteobacteria bacterium]|nr:PEGA domain-containing protein [Deltaproteobacteria bacterium]